ncbi:Uncharacterized protein K02A2.6 [Eumeta japonica]|uniref:Uncharacterized protein K02A2.6 n=1 Tax=Eumeta variegata TaxID=151549 RepID=A0A4C1YU72_EUMVA|nr:Uncharacterized protein K02A2.6 [Eumeta japonica]
MANEKGSLQDKIQKFLMTYRKTPNNATGLSPAEMMFKRLYRTRIDLVKREDTERESKNENLEINKEFKTGDRVQIRMYDNNKWKFGDIINRCGKLHYEIEVDGKIHHRHVDQIIKTYCVSDNQYPPDTYHQFNPMQPRETVQVTAERKREYTYTTCSGGDNTYNTVTWSY